MNIFLVAIVWLFIGWLGVFLINRFVEPGSESDIPLMLGLMLFGPLALGLAVALILNDIATRSAFFSGQSVLRFFGVKKKEQTFEELYR